jgi:hypothetical protein
MSLAEPVAVALDGQDVGVMDAALDERGCARGVREDGGLVLKRQFGGEHETLLLVASTDDLEEQVRVSRVEGQIADFVDHTEGDTRSAMCSSISRAVRAVVKPKRGRAA